MRELFSRAINHADQRLADSALRPRTTPLLVFIRECVVSLPLRISVASVYGGAHPLVMDALAEMPETQIPYVLAPPTQCAYIPPHERQEESRAGLPIS
jgi:hypothetical protein